MAYKKLSLNRTFPGRFADYFKVGNKINLPSNKWYGVMARQNYPDSIFLNGGAHFVGVKVGTNIADYVARTGTPAANLEVFTENPGWLKDYRPTKYFNEWTKEECYGAVDFERARRGGFPGLWTTATESYDDTFNWRNGASYARNQTKWLAERAGYWQDQQGFSFGDDYGGNLDLQIRFDTNNLSDMISALVAGPNACLAWMKANEGGDYQYFNLRRWENHDLLINSYWLNQRTDYQFVVKCLLQLRMSKMAMLADEVTIKRKVISYYMPEGIQFAGFLDIVTKSPFSGGTFGGPLFPIQTYASHVACGVMEFLDADIRQQWSDGIRHGTDLSVIKLQDYQNFIQFNGQPYRRADISYEFKNGDVPVSENFFGFQNGEEDGARQYGLATQWTGTQSWDYCPYRLASSSGSFTDNDAAYLIRRYQEKSLFAHRMIGVNGKKAIIGYAPDGDFKNYTFNLGNSTFTPADIDMPVPNAPFCYLIE